MKHTLRILALALTLVATLANGDTVVIDNGVFVSKWNDVARRPDWVVWELTPAMLPKHHVPREPQFTADFRAKGSSLNRDYAGSGYDKGHQCPAEDAAADVKTEHLSFSYINVVPQAPECNRVTWKVLEAYTRRECLTRGIAIMVVCGPLGKLSTIGPDKVEVPSVCWKAIRRVGVWTCYEIPNNVTAKQHKPGFYVVSLAQLEKDIGVTLNDILSAAKR